MVYLATVIAGLFSGASLALSFPRRARSGVCAATGEWAGWENVKNAFIFGDSYTDTGFNYTLEQPSSSNPFGNPEYPGYTSSNGPNWVGYLTFKHNASLLQTYNFADGGATVDSDLVAPYEPTVRSLKVQVQSEFLPAYTGETPTVTSDATWTGADSVFAIWIGINDVGNSYGSGANESEPLYSEIFSVYAGLVDELYDAGARNFVFIDTPPVDQSPLTVDQGEASSKLEKAAIASWNSRVDDMAGALKAKHAEVNVWVYSSSESFGAVMSDPGVYEQTAGLKNTTAYCPEYENGTDEEDAFVESCGVPVNEYFWLNNLHPTSPIHDVVAQGVADTLSASPNICGISTRRHTRVPI